MFTLIIERIDQKKSIEYHFHDRNTQKKVKKTIQYNDPKWL